MKNYLPATLRCLPSLFLLTGSLLTGLVLFSPSAGAYDEHFYSQAVAAYRSENYNRAREIWTDLAEDGHVPSMNNLAAMYMSGEGVPKNDAEAFKWSLMAAERKDVQAQARVGTMYRSGDLGRLVRVLGRQLEPLSNLHPKVMHLRLPITLAHLHVPQESA